MNIQDARLPADQDDTPFQQEGEIRPENIIINEIQLILAEKQYYFDIK